jgi:hypothetical protein
MKYTSQRNRLHAIEAQLGPRHLTIRITGGLPDEGAEVPPSSPLLADPEPADQPPPKPSEAAE